MKSDNPNDNLEPFPMFRGEGPYIPTPPQGKESWDRSSHLWTPQGGLENGSPPSKEVNHD